MCNRRGSKHKQANILSNGRVDAHGNLLGLTWTPFPLSCPTSSWMGNIPSLWHVVLDALGIR